MINRIQYLSGKVRRWHTHFDLNQTNADHSWGVALILIKMVKPAPSANLLKAAILHDCPEILTGDVPGYAKQPNSPVKKAMDECEEKAAKSLDLVMPELTEEERLWLSLADAIEAMLFVKHCGRFSQEEALLHFPAIIKKVRTFCHKLGQDADALIGEFSR